jgi:hypothetical protein
MHTIWEPPDDARDLEIARNIRKIYNIYPVRYAPPKWILDINLSEHYMKTARVYYDFDPENIETLEEVHENVFLREPVNIGLNKMYNKSLLKKEFGYSKSSYSEDSSNIAIYAACKIRYEQAIECDEVKNKSEHECYVQLSTGDIKIDTSMSYAFGVMNIVLSVLIFISGSIVYYRGLTASADHRRRESERTNRVIGMVRV